MSPPLPFSTVQMRPPPSLRGDDRCLTPGCRSQDNTLWTPELYQLRTTPKAGKDIWLFDGAQDALFEIATQV